MAMGAVMLNNESQVVHNTAVYGMGAAKLKAVQICVNPSSSNLSVMGRLRVALQCH